ncbi:methyltransferase, TIGR04325 family [Loktanella salsilacus]|uniref:methyltransferase, TIGR04325 family n=1 Tax=Loktanella salsilacus TaxID=195913 RepID=UPI00300348F2
MTVSASPRLGKRLRAVLRQARALPGAAIARAVTRTARARHFSGAFDTRAAAQEAVIRRGGQGYDDAAISEVSFDLMCQRTAWDYPVMFWLQRFLPDADALIDAGGHFGTKYIAFQDLIDLRPIRWNVYDLPAIVHAARRRQGRGGLPVEIAFHTDVTTLPAAQILLCSGLLQYQDIAFPDFVATLPDRPEYIILNKVALRDGPELYTIEKIGAGCVPYRMRNRSIFEAQINVMGYDILDSWNIPNLGHVISTHPWLGRSESRGYVLRCKTFQK